MNDDFQIEIPPSFRALYLDARGRLQLRPRELLARYELCEDLAQQLVDTARPVHLDIGLPTDEVLERIGRGLHTPEAGLNAGEPAWVLRRLAELLDWAPLTDAAADGDDSAQPGG